MKLIALCAALALTGTAAIAQDTAAPAPADPATAAVAEDPVGGYQPAAPALSAKPEPGQQIIFQPSKSPAEAYPAPAPLANYPICKKGQFDNCRQRGG